MATNYMVVDTQSLWCAIVDTPETAQDYADRLNEGHDYTRYEVQAYEVVPSARDIIADDWCVPETPDVEFHGGCDY